MTPMNCNYLSYDLTSSHITIKTLDNKHTRWHATIKIIGCHRPPYQHDLRITDIVSLVVCLTIYCFTSPWYYTGVSWWFWPRQTSWIWFLLRTNVLSDLSSLRSLNEHRATLSSRYCSLTAVPHLELGLYFTSREPFVNGVHRLNREFTWNWYSGGF